MHSWSSTTLIAMACLVACADCTHHRPPRKEMSPVAGLPARRTLDDELAIEMVLIAAGETRIAMPPIGMDQPSSLGPLRKEPDRVLNEELVIRIAKPFYMSKYKITQGQWERIMGTDPADPRGSRLPVHGVSWFDCEAFCQALSKRVAEEVDLPLTSEWMYASLRGKADSPAERPSFFSASDVPGWRVRSTMDGDRVPVDSSPANSSGLCGMDLEPAEWCADGAFTGFMPNGQVIYDPGRSVRGGLLYLLGGLDRYYLQRRDPDDRASMVSFRIAIGGDTKARRRSAEADVHSAGPVPHLFWAEDIILARGQGYWLTRDLSVGLIDFDPAAKTASIRLGTDGQVVAVREGQAIDPTGRLLLKQVCGSGVTVHADLVVFRGR
jgi:formylglycine-generating enzyme required for sulfatase activity